MYSIYKWYFTKYLPLLRFATNQKPDQQNPTGMAQIKYTRKKLSKGMFRGLAFITT